MAIVVFIGGVIAQDDVISSSSNTEFNVFFQNPECVIVNSENRLSYPDPTYHLGQSLWISIEYSPDDSLDNCFKKDGAEGVQKCCPVNFDCVGYDVDDVDGGKCMSNVVTTCGGYKSKGACDDDSNPLVAHNDLNPRLNDDGYGEDACADYYGSYRGSSSCYEFFDCKCEWDEEEEVCESNSNHQIKKVNEDQSEVLYPHDNLPSDINGICGIDGGSEEDNNGLGVGNCAIQYTIVGDCSAGEDFVTRSWTAVFQNNAQDPFCNSDLDCSESFGSDYFCKGVSGPGICVPNYCQPGSEVIPCDRVVRLPFFSLQNIIIAIILLVIIYYFILKKKKK